MVTMTSMTRVVVVTVIVLTVVDMIRFAYCGRHVRRRMAGVIRVRAHTPD